MFCRGDGQIRRLRKLNGLGEKGEDGKGQGAEVGVTIELECWNIDRFAKSH